MENLSEEENSERAVSEKKITKLQTLQQNLAIISQRGFSKTQRQRKQNLSGNLTSWKNFTKT